MKFARYRKAVAGVVAPLIAASAAAFGYTDIPEELINALVTIITFAAVVTGAVVYLVPNDDS